MTPLEVFGAWHILCMLIATVMFVARDYHELSKILPASDVFLAGFIGTVVCPEAVIVSLVADILGGFGKGDDDDESGEWTVE